MLRKGDLATIVKVEGEKYKEYLNKIGMVEISECQGDNRIGIHYKDGRICFPLIKNVIKLEI